MRQSNFQFTTPVLTGLIFEPHSNFTQCDNVDFTGDLKVLVNYDDSGENSEVRQATVTVYLTIGTDDDSTPFLIKAEESAHFRWKTNAYSEKQEKVLLNQNAPTLLLSYLRPIIANITLQSSYPAYNLPYIDLTDSGNQKRE